MRWEFVFNPRILVCDLSPFQPENHLAEEYMVSLSLLACVRACVCVCVSFT